MVLVFPVWPRGHRQPTWYWRMWRHHPRSLERRVNRTGNKNFSVSCLTTWPGSRHDSGGCDVTTPAASGWGSTGPETRTLVFPVWPRGQAADIILEDVTSPPPQPRARNQQDRKQELWCTTRTVKYYYSIFTGNFFKNVFAKSAPTVGQVSPPFVINFTLMLRGTGSCINTIQKPKKQPWKRDWTLCWSEAKFKVPVLGIKSTLARSKRIPWKFWKYSFPFKMTTSNSTH